MTWRSDSGSRRSPNAVELATSEKTTVTIFRTSPRVASSSARRVPQARQKRAAAGFCCPQLGQIVTSCSQYDGAVEGISLTNHETCGGRLVLPTGCERCVLLRRRARSARVRGACRAVVAAAEATPRGSRSPLKGRARRRVDPRPLGRGGSTVTPANQTFGGAAGCHAAMAPAAAPAVGLEGRLYWWPRTRPRCGSTWSCV